MHDGVQKIKMENENNIPALKKEHLYPEQSFMHYCERDEMSSRKLPRPITKVFLDACEKDRLVVPLLKQIETVHGDGAQTQEVEIRYYSPFQIYLVAALSENEIDEDGNLCDATHREYGKEHNTRFINWGGWSAFNVDIYRKKKEEDLDEKTDISYFLIADDFHQLLKLIHTLKEETEYERVINGRNRYFRNLPRLQYDLRPVQEGGKEIW